MSKNGKSTYAIQSVEHAFDLLEQFRGQDAEFGVTDLSRRMKLSKNKIFRLLSTLKSRNYIEQDQQTENYRLGFKAVELRQPVVRRLKPFSCVRPMLEAMAKECNETVCYSVLDNFDVVTIDKYDCAHALRASTQIGELSPSYCTAAGKAMLAHMADDVLEEYFSCRQFEQYTPYTITNSVQLRKQLQEIALRGYAVASEEMYMGMSSVGAVIRDHTLRTVGAVTLVGPSERLKGAKLTERLIPLLLTVTADISGKLGCSSSACLTAP